MTMVPLARRLSRPVPLRLACIVVAALLFAPACGAREGARSDAGGGRAAADAAGAENVYTGFQIVGDFIVEIDGKEWPRAEVYQSDRARAYLILAASLPAPVMVEVATQQVTALNLMKVAKQPDGSVDLLPDAKLAPQGGFTVAGQEVSFRAQGRAVRLKSRPWLLGRQTTQEMLDHNPEYIRRAKAYVPMAAVVQQLEAVRSEVEVKVFFGTWCPHCKEHVPLVLRLAQELAGSKVKFAYYGLPSPFKDEPEATKWNVTGVPTAIVLVGGKEIGRVPTAGWAHPEAAILTTLSNAGLAG